MPMCDFALDRQASDPATYDLLTVALSERPAQTVPELVAQLGVPTEVLRRALEMMRRNGRAERDPCDRWRLADGQA
jgi:DNA-binding IclR family transcriptional regulator